MKTVFALTSDVHDNYLEQLYLSLISYYEYNSDRAIVLADSETLKSLVGGRRKISELAEVIEAKVPNGLSKKEKSRWLKTSIPEYINESFLFVDCDTIICGDILSIEEEFQSDICAVVDKHVPIKDHSCKKLFERNDNMLGFRSSFEGLLHFNSGVLYCSNTVAARKFYTLWHCLWEYSNKKGISIDQPALNEANRKMGWIIRELPGEWNCQINDNGLKYLYNAKIIHYFASYKIFKNPFLLSSPALLSSIREGTLTDEEIRDLVVNAKSAFAEKLSLIADESVLRAYNSIGFRLLRRWFRFLGTGQL